MRKKQPKKTTSKSPDTRGRDLVREAVLVAGLAAQVVVLVAVITYAPEPTTTVPIVGVVGHYVAHGLWTAFGAVSFVLIALGIFTSLLALVRRALTTPLLRVVGGVMMLVGSCALVHQILHTQIAVVTGAGAHPFDVTPGGVLGQWTFELLLTPIGAFGTLVFSVVVMCTGFAFATDWLLYEMLFSGARRLAAATTVFRRFWPEPAAIAGGMASLRSLNPLGGTAGGTATLRREPAQDKAAKDESAKDKSQPKTKPKKTRLPEIDTPFNEDPNDDPTPREEVAPEKKTRTPKSVKPGKAEQTAKPKQPDAVAPPLVVLDDPEVVVPAEMLSPETLPAAPKAVAEERAPPEAAPEPEPEPVTALPVLEVKLEPQIQPPQPAELRIPRTKGEYEFPGLDLLDTPKPRDLRRLEEAIQKNAEILQKTLAEFRIEGRVVNYQQGPVVTMLEIALAPGTKVTRIHSLADDLAMALKVTSVRIVAPIPGKSTVGVEIPNPIRDDVRMVTLMESAAFRNNTQAIPLLLGVRGNGEPMVDDLAKMPHLLVAGATGAGKSVCINSVLLSILMARTPDEVKLILIDPKQVELAFFADIPHLLSPVVTDMKRAASVLEWAVQKMEERYDLLRRFEVRNIASYNELGEEAIRARIEELGLSDEVIPVKLPYIVIVVDELADLMLTAGKEIEKLITRLAQKSRAVGIHIMLATQRPSTDVITGLIKANMPTRIAFQVTSKVDSRVILDQNGADKLLGMGDMLYLPPRSSSVARAQGTFASDQEVKRVVGFLKKRYSAEFNEELVEIGTMCILDDSEKDNLYDEAVRVVLHEHRGSASLLQRALAIGYTRASRLLDLMRKEGVVGAYKGSKASDVLLTLDEYESRVAAANAAKKKKKS